MTASTTPAAPAAATFRRRRAVRNTVAAVLAATGLWWALGSTTPDTSARAEREAPANAPAEPTAEPDNPVLAAQNDALAQLRAGGTLDTWSPRDQSVRHAAAGTTAVLSWLGTDGTCWYGAVADGAPTAIAVDPSARACTEAEIASAQASLAAQRDAGQRAADASAEAALAQGIAAVQFWARTNGGSFAGLPAEAAPGVAVLAASEVSVSLQASVNGGCAAATVTATGVTPSAC